MARCRFFFKQEPAYKVVISDWSSDVCSSDLSAAVLIADDEQPDREELGAQPALHRLPNLFPGERQLPSGPGLPPPSEPSLPGMEPDLPATQQPEPDPAMQEELSQLVTGQGNKLRASETRSEESHVGKEWASTLRSRGSPYDQKKNTNK